MSDDRNPKDLLGIKKVRLSLVPESSVIYQATAMENGADKYGPYNWRTKKVIASIYIDACKRHLGSWFDGEELASDSKVHHLAHAIACLGIIIDAKETGNLIDDRPTPGAASRLIEDLKIKKELTKQQDPVTISVNVSSSIGDTNNKCKCGDEKCQS